ncbi:hypothetical protein BGZ61DRAFT_373581 [Ilyonectria robusta]|uniref:uncharacterized protein n=1 Tax=Ilyonectria robusta TaxID=1079257 RepID=UPI001E8EBE5C|nr:uncharacterized protein BGZ61DRAFT_373581 [Ilyonectria robusta]KAH8654397.1 hypothetical protein BGZ61DRAFT_373581 [Ilyonectria robusta]
MATPRETAVQSYARTLISASHILHLHNVLDAYGRVSVRHPTKPGIFVMPRNIAPGTLSSESDLVEYYISDSSPVTEPSPAGYAERCIHSEIHKKFDVVNSRSQFCRNRSSSVVEVWSRS